MNLLRFDTIAYTPPARAEARFPVLAGQARCSTGVTLRGSQPAATPVVSWQGQIVRQGESDCG